jgi:hypothetical protein
MKARKKEAAPKPKRPAPVPPVKKVGKIETAHEPKKLHDSPPMPEDMINEIAGCFEKIKDILLNYAVQLKALDRRRLNGVGKPTRGFIDKAFELAESNQELLPSYCPIEKFSEDVRYFLNFSEILGLCDYSRGLLWNITLMSADTAYKDALIFYTQAREAKINGIGAQEGTYNELFPFFKKSKRDGAGPTQKEAISDFKAVLHGKREGEVAVRNVKPKVVKGRREVVDEEFTTNGTNGHER